MYEKSGWNKCALKSKYGKKKVATIFVIYVIIVRKNINTIKRK